MIVKEFYRIEVINLLYRTLRRMIERGQTAGMEEKIDIFYAADKITEAQYTELIGMLSGEDE